METKYDDDRFYADIRRQILLLTSEDDEDLLERKSTGVFIPQPVTSEDNASPLVWPLNLWKRRNEKEKGTGVFIPQATYKRKQKPVWRQIYRPVVKK
ncbi:hypothetical protein TanjilG_15147 [Lupinus angustifolius]|uniref:Uncharacterized protein n=1 Tax=Lupinus angustifolius TaxID=3871 RepID=A0A1J7GP10_LUPAN|nr:PREDICTED: uncharacterized protein LOC109360130 [Lupinus angustifolius]OIW02264.1 hypothetical protein TanjilG_15147 [Lupinus angustifolius]